MRTSIRPARLLRVLAAIAICSHASITSDEGPSLNPFEGIARCRSGRATIAAETSRPVPSAGEIDKMARRRYQNPKPFREGAFWWLLLRQDEIVNGQRIRKRKRVKLAPASMPLREAQKVAAEHLSPLNAGLVTLGSATNFGEYVNSVYLPNNMPLLSTTTQERYAGVIKNYLMPAFGGLALRDLTPLSLQRYFSALATSKLSYESKDKIRDVLSSILVSAKQYGLIVTNPAEGVRLPPSKKGKRNKPYLNPEQFAALVRLVPEPYATMIYVAIFTGLRASEVIGLKWRNVHEDSITVDERYCRGDWGAPKSQASNATIAVNRDVIARLHQLNDVTVEVRAGHAIRHHRLVKSSGPDDLVFQSVRDGVEMRDNNVLVRFIKPAARSLGIGWVNWQCLRRSHAMWLKLAGADPKDAQAQMRHSRVNTTLDIYQQFDIAAQRRAVDRLGTLASGGMVN